MPSRTKTVDMMDSSVGFAVFSFLTIVVVLIVPFSITALIAQTGSLKLASGVGIVLLVGNLAVLWFGARPLFKKAIYRVGFIRKVVRNTIGSKTNAVRRYISHWRNGEEMTIVYATVAEIAGKKAVRIEFVSNRRFGATVVGLDELMDLEEVDELSPVEEDDFGDWGYCTLVNNCDRSKLRLGVFDTLRDEDSSYYYSCQDCIGQIMEEAREWLAEEQTSETVARTL